MKRTRFTWQVTPRLQTFRDLNVNFCQSVHAALYSGCNCPRAEAPGFSWPRLVSKIEAPSDAPSYFPRAEDVGNPILWAVMRPAFLVTVVQSFLLLSFSFSWPCNMLLLYVFTEQSVRDGWGWLEAVPKSRSAALV